MNTSNVEYEETVVGYGRFDLLRLADELETMLDRARIVRAPKSVVDGLHRIVMDLRQPAPVK